MHKRIIKTIHGENEYYLPEEVEEKLEQKDKEIERLRKENKWLITTCAGYLYDMMKIVSWKKY